MPEFAISYDEKWIEETYRRVGLVIARVDYGSWYGRGDPISYQDLVLAVKQ